MSMRWLENSNNFKRLARRNSESKRVSIEFNRLVSRFLTLNLKLRFFSLKDEVS